MIGIVVVGHGKMAEELIKSAEMIMGKQDKIFPVHLTEEMGPETLVEEVKKAVGLCASEEGVLILTDLYGGSTTNFVAANLISSGYRVEIVSGVNLPMLLSVLCERTDLNLAKLAEKAVMDGKEGIMNVRKILNLDSISQETKSGG